MTIDPRHLANLLAVVRHGSFNRAATARGLSQPALSNSVAMLERKLNARVMDRTRRGSTLTEIGAILARRALTLESLLAQIEEEVRLKGLGIEGPLTVGATTSAMLRLIPDTMDTLLAQHPKISISIIEGLDDQLVPRLQAGEIDILVCPVMGLHQAPAGIIEEVLFRDTFSIGVGPNHRLARRKSVKLAELVDEAWILPAQSSSYRRHLEAIFISAGVPWPNDRISTSSMSLVESVVTHTDRITIISRLQAANRKRGGLISVPMEGAGGRMIGIKRRDEAEIAPLAQAFIACLREACRSFQTSADSAQGYLKKIAS